MLFILVNSSSNVLVGFVRCCFVRVFHALRREHGDLHADKVILFMGLSVIILESCCGDFEKILAASLLSSWRGPGGQVACVTGRVSGRGRR